MPAPTTTGGGLMGYPSTVDTGQITPAIVSDETGSLVASSNTLTSNAVYLWAFELSSNATILGGKWHMAATTTSTANMAIYTLAGNLVAGSDSGAVTNVASSDVSFTYATPILLAPGQYFMALASHNGTDTYNARGFTTTAATRARKATNAMSSDVMPSTTGTLLTTVVALAYSLTVSGGL